MPNVVRWDDTYGVLVDEMGIMLPISNVELLMNQCMDHINQHTTLEREAIGRRTVERLGKSTTLQFNFDYFVED